jgi:subfamily B ATP-binding cassette protein MsbA
MKDFIELYKYTFSYRYRAILVIVYNLLFVVFNLLSLLLFIPFLQVIFKPEPTSAPLIQPHWSGNFSELITYGKDAYNFFMQELVRNDPKQALFIVCLSVLGAFLFKNIFRYAAVWHQSELRMAVVRDLRNQLFYKALILPLSYYSDERRGDLMTRMNNDVGEIEIAVVSVLELVYREPIAIIINVITLFYLSPELTLVSFILLPVSAFVISRIGKSLKRTARQSQEQMGVLFSSIEEGLNGIRVIKAFNAIQQVYSSFQRVNLIHQKLVTKAFRKRDLSPILNETLGAIVMLALVWFGGSIILDTEVPNRLTGEIFLTFIIVFSQLLRPIQGIATNIAFLNKAKASQDRINQVLKADEKIIEKELPERLSEFTDKIVFSDVTFKYKDDIVLHNINLTIEKGKTIALVGESGSGKSTLGDLLPRFYDVTSGKISIDGIDIQDYSIRDVRGQIGLVSQESILFNASIKENIAFGMPEACIEQIIEAATIANAHEFIAQLEHGYDTQIGERGNKLSGGQKQRLSIARAVLKNPSILVLDEATSALDTESEKLVQDALEQLMKGRTTIVIAHRLSTVRKADEIIVLSKGKIVERGTHQSLLELGKMYYTMCSLQGLSD